MAVSRFSRDEGGVVIVIFAVLSVVVFAIIGAAIDYSKIARDRTILQDTMDASVLAGARTSLSDD